MQWSLLWTNVQQIFGKICLKSITAKYCKKSRNLPVRVDIEVLGQYWHHPPGAPDIQTLIIAMILWWLWYNEVVLYVAPDIQTIWWCCCWFTMFAGAQRLVLTQTQFRLLTGGLVGGGTWKRQSPWTSNLITIELVEILQYLNQSPENLWTSSNPDDLFLTWTLLTTGGAEPGQTALPQGLL